VARGHDVALFASGDSRTTARLHSVVPVATQNDPSATSYIEREMDVRNAAEAYAREAAFDLFHAHWPTPAAYFSDRTGKPTVLTCAYIERPLYDWYRQRYANVHPVCVSRAQSRMLGGGLPVIPYGVDVEHIPFGSAPEDLLVTVGRMVPHKGADRAIAIAKQTGLPLVVVGAVTPYLAESEPFFEERIRPHVDGRAVRHIPHLPNKDVLKLVSRARALLFPISWEEPFGLVVAEAMAAGTPVIATPRGSLPELVEEGVTGFLAETDAELAASVRRVEEIDRAGCRRWTAERFSADRMVSDYEAFYKTILT
jgi:glycosyltransferase involved in cell wall biosynthesis